MNQDDQAGAGPLEPTVMQRPAAKCCSTVWPLGAYRSVACGLGAKYEHEGKAYCKTHHPPTVRAKRDAKNAAFNSKWEQQQARESAAIAVREALRKDAERYRWLRGNGWADATIYATGPKEWGANGVALLCGDQLDSVIDGAIGAA